MDCTLEDIHCAKVDSELSDLVSTPECFVCRELCRTMANNSLDFVVLDLDKYFHSILLVRIPYQLIECPSAIKPFSAKDLLRLEDLII